MMQKLQSILQNILVQYLMNWGGAALVALGIIQPLSITEIASGVVAVALGIFGHYLQVNGIILELTGTSNAAKEGQ